MRKFTLFFAIYLLYSVAFGQQLNYDKPISEVEARAHANFLKNSKDIIQTPLLNDYDVKFYFLNINVENTSIYVSGDVTYKAQVVATELDTFACELVGQMTVDEILINGTAQNVIHTNDEVFVPLDNPIPEGELFTAVISYHGTPPTGGFFSGITNTTDWGKQVTWTLSEPFAAREWWPAKQVLEDKADSAWVFLTTSVGNMAGSEGLLTAVTPMPDNKQRFEWKTRYPIDYYLLSFAVSEYQDYSIYAHPEQMAPDSLLIQNFIYDAPGCLETYQDNIDETAAFIELYSNLFQLYPFHQEKYGHCLTALGGGMEHQTMTTIGGFSFDLVAHELGHMWFGDYITCATWSDVWVNEGFATYCDYLANEYILGQGAANSQMNAIHNNVMSQSGGSTYVPPADVTYNNIWRIFDNRLSYNKGAAILHMIRFELQDDDMFFQVLSNYLDQYGGGTATGLDFMNVLNQTSGMDFTDFFDQWYFGEGYPTYSIIWSQNTSQFTMQVIQTVSKPSVTPLFKMLMAYKLHFTNQTDTTVYFYQTANTNTFSIPLSKEVSSIQIDPDNWVLNKVGSITVNVEEKDNPVHFTFSPNPVKNELNLTFLNSSTSTRQIRISDLSGNRIISMKTGNDHLSLDVSSLSAGYYLLDVKDGPNRLTRKFIKMD